MTTDYPVEILRVSTIMTRSAGARKATVRPMASSSTLPGVDDRGTRGPEDRSRVAAAAHHRESLMTSRIAWHVLIPVLVGLILRVVFVTGNWDSPFFLTPLVDAEEFHEQAVWIADGNAYPERPFARPPLFIYAVAGLYKLFGTDMRVVIVAQQILGLLTIALTSMIGARFFGRRVALIAGIIIALSRLPILLEGQLLNETLQTALLAACVLFVDGALTRRSGVQFAFAALTGALAILTRPTSALFVVPALLYPAVARRVPSERTRLLGGRSIVLAALLFVVVGGSAAVRNRIVGNEWVAVSNNGGINFFIGNAVRHDELIDIRPGMAWERLSRSPRSLEETDVFRIAPFDDGYGAWDRRYYGAGLADMVDNPGGALGRLVRKGAQFWSALWVDRNLPPSAFIADDSPLRFVTLPFGIVGPIALAGLVWLGVTRRCGWRLLLLMIGSVWLTCIVFFVTSRYRVPAYPAMAVAGGFIVVEWVGRLRAWLAGRSPTERGAAIGIGATLLCALVFSWTDPGNARRIAPARSTYLRGIALERTGNSSGALASYNEALAESPDDPDILQSTALLLVKFGQPERAATLLERAAAAMPDHPLPPFNAGLAYLLLERHEDAVDAFRRAVAIRSDLARYYVYLGKALAAGGRAEDALVSLDRAIEIRSDEPYAWMEKGRVLLRLGLEEEAREALATEIVQNPSSESVLLQDPELVPLLRRSR